MRWEGGRAWMSENLIEWERAAREKIKGRMEDLGMWAREGSKRIKSSSVVYEKSHRKNDISLLISRS
jgi:hypothetical protein